MTTTGLPFACARCGLRYGSDQGPALLRVEGDTTNIKVAGNVMQCPRCGSMNRQELADGTYNIRGGHWQLVRRLAGDLLSAEAEAADYARLAALLRQAKLRNEDAHQVADKMDEQTPFARLAQTIRDHPPGWTVYIFTAILTVLLWIVPSLMAALYSNSPGQPRLSTNLQHLSAHELDEIARKIAKDLKQDEPRATSPSEELPRRTPPRTSLAPRKRHKIEEMLWRSAGVGRQGLTLKEYMRRFAVGDAEH